MIRQHAPCVNTRRDRRDCGKQPVTEIRHPVGRVTDIWLVIETSCREMICAPTANAMRRAVPRKTMLLAPCDKRGALFRCQFAPEIHGDRKSTRSPDGKNVVNRSRLKAGLRTAVIGHFFSCKRAIPCSLRMRANSTPLISAKTISAR